MACTVLDYQWFDETSVTIPTTYYRTEATAEDRSTTPSSSLLSYKIALLFFGVVGTLTNGFVLGGFWLCGRTKMTSSSVQIANHTTLRQQPDSITRHPFAMTKLLDPAEDTDPLFSRYL